MNTVEDKTLLITGTSRGIGHEFAKHFLGLGYRVLGISRSQTPLDHPRFVQIRADLNHPEDLHAVRQAVLRYPVAGLINNAGIHGPIGPFEQTDVARWINTFQVNLFSPVALSHMCIPDLKKLHGFIIFLSGGGSGFAKPDFSAYSVSKTAVVRFAENLARELSPDVLVYCMAPGPNRTELLDEAVRGGEVLSPEDVVDFSYPIRLCEFLAKNTDPRYSGKFIHVKDNYAQWTERQLTADAYTLRRMKV